MNNSKRNSKFNPWPYALIVFFGFFISLIVLFIVFALGQNMELVRSDYYEQEMRYQQQIDREQRTQMVQDEVAITYDSQGQMVGVKLPSRHARENLTGSIHFYRPSNAQLDHEVTLTVGLDGQQNVPVDSLAVGLWNLRVFWEVGGEEYFTRQSVVIAAR